MQHPRKSGHGTLIELRIDSLAAGGDGIGRDGSGRVTFVPLAAPGDRVRCEVVEEKKAFARARVVALLEAGASRVSPPCPSFADGSCGGCRWQHVSAEAQAVAKRDIVVSALRSLVDADHIASIATPVPTYGWRRRARLHWFRPRGAERALIGLFGPRSHRVTDIQECAQLDATLSAALSAIREHLAPGLAKHGEIELVSGHQGDAHVTVHGPCAAAAARGLVGHGGIVGVRARRREFGAANIEIEPGLWGTADSFAQASTDGNRALVACVQQAIGDAPGRVLELFAGTGNFTRLLAERAVSVTAVDEMPSPARSAGVTWRRGDAAEVTRELCAEAVSGQPGAFDVAVLDPPRTGAREVVDALVELSPARIVYVSCDPATLARDLARATAAGYSIESVEPLDLMPQTAHVEVVVALTRG